MPRAASVIRKLSFQGHNDGGSSKGSAEGASEHIHMLPCYRPGLHATPYACWMLCACGISLSDKLEHGARFCG
jgi:hypothetical protein